MQQRSAGHAGHCRMFTSQCDERSTEMTGDGWWEDVRAAALRSLPCDDR